MTHTVCIKCNRNWIFDDAVLCRKCTTQKNVLEQIIDKVSNHNPDIDYMIDSVSELMVNTQVRLNDKEIKQVCDAYYKNGEQTSERLTMADNLFLQIHHVNEMVPQ